MIYKQLLDIVETCLVVGVVVVVGNTRHTDYWSVVKD
jgi:hypothetical protein